MTHVPSSGEVLFCLIWEDQGQCGLETDNRMGLGSYLCVFLLEKVDHSNVIFVGDDVGFGE